MGHQFPICNTTNSETSSAPNVYFPTRERPCGWNGCSRHVGETMQLPKNKIFEAFLFHLHEVGVFIVFSKIMNPTILKELKILFKITNYIIYVCFFLTEVLGNPYEFAQHLYAKKIAALFSWMDRENYKIFKLPLDKKWPTFKKTPNWGRNTPFLRGFDAISMAISLQSLISPRITNRFFFEKSWMLRNFGSSRPHILWWTTHVDLYKAAAAVLRKKTLSKDPDFEHHLWSVLVGIHPWKLTWQWINPNFR